MTPQYTYDSQGNPVGVFIPIKDWNSLTEKYAGLEEVSESEQAIIDQRLDYIKNNPDQLIPISDFLKELDVDDEI